DGTGQVGRNDVQLDVPDPALGRWNVNSVDGEIAQPRVGPANLDILPLALVPLQSYTRKSPDRVGDVGIGEAGYQFGGHHIDDVVVALLRGERLRLAPGPRRHDRDLGQ